MSQKLTRSIKEDEIHAKWLLIDATGKRIGKLSTKIVNLLTGKDKVINSDYLVNGDKVIVINVLKMDFGQQKLNNKTYPIHSGYPGGFKELKLRELIGKKPDYIIRQAVWGMLAKNKISRKLLSNLYVFADENHNFEAQKPIKV